MIAFFSGCGRLFNMTFSAAFALDYFKLLALFLLLQIGVGLVRLTLSGARRM